MTNAKCSVFDITQCKVKDGEAEEPKAQAQKTQQAAVYQEKTVEQSKAYDPAEKSLPPDVPNYHLNDGTTLEHLAKVLKYIFM